MPLIQLLARMNAAAKTTTKKKVTTTTTTKKKVTTTTKKKVTTTTKKRVTTTTKKQVATTTVRPTTSTTTLGPITTTTSTTTIAPPTVTEIVASNYQSIWVRGNNGNLYEPVFHGSNLTVKYGPSNTYYPYYVIKTTPSSSPGNLTAPYLVINGTVNMLNDKYNNSQFPSNTAMYFNPSETVQWDFI